MNALSLTTVVTIFFLVSLVDVITSMEEEDSAGECLAAPNGRELNLSVDRRLNQSDGYWLTTFSARRIDPERNEMALEAKHRHVECQGRHVVNILVVVKEISKDPSSRSLDARNAPLLFHRRHGTNVAILNNGRSVEKIDLNVPEHSVVFTNRPLMKKEMFEVRLDKRAGKTKHCLGIGVMSLSPDDVEVVSSMHRLASNNTRMYHDNGIYGNSKPLVKDYGHNINTLQARDRVGVMQLEDGSIHFYVNGEDQGPAVANMPQPIFGVFELWHDAQKGTIVY